MRRDLTLTIGCLALLSYGCGRHRSSGSEVAPTLPIDGRKIDFKGIQFISPGSVKATTVGPVGPRQRLILQPVEQTKAQLEIDDVEFGGEPRFVWGKIVRAAAKTPASPADQPYAKQLIDGRLTYSKVSKGPGFVAYDGFFQTESLYAKFKMRVQVDDAQNEDAPSRDLETVFRNLIAVAR